MPELDFFERVKILAKQNKTTIESVVNSAGLTINSYNSYKRHGNLPRLDEGVKIARALGVSVEYLVTGEDSDEKSKILKEMQSVIDRFA